MPENESYRSIPKVDIVLKESVLQELRYDERIVKRLIRERLEFIRTAITQGRSSASPDASTV
ncbi:MAG: hypothetical protein ABSC14_03515, partial [Desulfomonilia bacterium]